MCVYVLVCTCVYMHVCVCVSEGEIPGDGQMKHVVLKYLRMNEEKQQLFRQEVRPFLSLARRSNVMKH